MQYIIVFILAVMSSMLIDNVVLSRFYGICPFLGVSRKVKSSLGMGIAVVFVIVLATLICWPLYNYVLVPAKIQFMDTVAYILIIRIKMLNPLKCIECGLCTYTCTSKIAVTDYIRKAKIMAKL